MAAKALVIFCALWSKLPAQPTQNNTSGVSPAAITSAITGTFIPCNLFKCRAKSRFFNLHSALQHIVFGGLGRMMKDAKRRKKDDKRSKGLLRRCQKDTKRRIV